MRRGGYGAFFHYDSIEFDVTLSSYLCPVHDPMLGMEWRTSLRAEHTLSTDNQIVARTSLIQVRMSITKDMPP